MHNLVSNSVANPKPAHTKASGKILVVDDIYDNCFLLQIILEIEGYQVEIATDGLSALTQVETNSPDLILLDLMMPGMSGYEVAQRIRQDHNLSSIPIVLITAHDPFYLDFTHAEKINGFIKKPIQPEKLLEQVRVLLKSNRSH